MLHAFVISSIVLISQNQEGTQDTSYLVAHLAITELDHITKPGNKGVSMVPSQVIMMNATVIEARGSGGGVPFPKHKNHHHAISSDRWMNGEVRWAATLTLLND